MGDEKVVILCGGKGTRLREETEFRPKPLVLVGDKPILWHIMKTYSHYGYNNFVLCLGYKGDMIKDYFLNLDYTHDFKFNPAKKELDIFNKDLPDWNIIFANTGIDSQTGHRIRQIQKYINEDNFFLTYGDGLADISINDLYNFHKNHGKIATVTTVRPFTRFGNLTISDTGNLVTDFEKKSIHHIGWIDGGFFVFKPSLFDYLEPGEDLKLEAEPLRKLAKDGQFHAYKHNGFWQCMDNIRDHEFLNELWDSGRAPWKVW